MSLIKGIFKKFVNELCDLENILEIFCGKEKVINYFDSFFFYISYENDIKFF